MGIYYLDKDCTAHVEQAEGLVPWNDENGDFDGKDTSYIESFRVVPAGESWTRGDGCVFTGLMIAPKASADGTAQSVGLVAALQSAMQTIASLDEAMLELEYQNALLALGLT